jgi:hypothetical protein
VVQIGEKTSPAPTHKPANRGLFIWSAALFILAVLCVLGPLTLFVTAGSAPGVMPLAVTPAARPKAVVMPLAVTPAARPKAVVMPLAVPPAARSTLPLGLQHIDLYRDTSRILNTGAPRRAALVRKQTRSWRRRKKSAISKNRTLPSAANSLLSPAEIYNLKQLFLGQDHERSQR